MEEVPKKINWHNEVHTYWHKFWHHTWWSPKTLKMFLESIFGQFWWPSSLMSKLTPISVNLIVSFFLQTSCLTIWHLTSFLTTWHLLTFDTYNLNHLSPHRAIFWELAEAPACRNQVIGLAVKSWLGCQLCTEPEPDLEAWTWTWD